DDDRYAPAPRRQVAGGGDVAAEADEHVGLDPVEDAAGDADRAGEPAGDGEELRCERAWQRYGRHELELVAAGGHQPGLQAPFGAEAGDPDRRVDLAWRIGKRQCRFDMAGRTAAGEDHPHVTPCSESSESPPDAAAAAPA